MHALREAMEELGAGRMPSHHDCLAAWNPTRMGGGRRFRLRKLCRTIRRCCIVAASRTGAKEVSALKRVNLCGGGRAIHSGQRGAHTDAGGEQGALNLLTRDFEQGGDAVGIVAFDITK